MDHIVPTRRRAALRRRDGRGDDGRARAELPRVRHPALGLSDAQQGIVHVIGPELGLTQPGMTIACGDSHTSTHGAFGAVAFGIGTSQVRDVLASQCLAMDPLKVRRISVDGALGAGVYPKDVILAIIRRLGVKGGVGLRLRVRAAAPCSMTMDERMTICNMSIEGGARVGLHQPGRDDVRLPRGAAVRARGRRIQRAVAWWRRWPPTRARPTTTRCASTGGDRADRDLGDQPRAVGVGWRADPRTADLPEERARAAWRSARVHGLRAGRAHRGHAHRRGVHRIVHERAAVGPARSGARRARAAGRRHVRALAVPGSQAVRQAAEAEGLHQVFKAAGFEWRDAGCSMCLAMNADRLAGRQMCAASSNRNFKGRQGSPTGGRC